MRKSKIDPAQAVPPQAILNTKAVSAFTDALISISADISKHVEKEVNLQVTSLESRLRQVSDKLQLELLKTTVVTEVSRVYPNILPQLVRALDNSDPWWNAGKKLTIEEWSKYVLGKIKFKAAPVEAASEGAGEEDEDAAS